MRTALLTTVALAGLVAVPFSQAQRDERPTESMERAFAAGGLVAFDLVAGDYRITGSPDARIHVLWRTRDRNDDEIDARVAIDVKATEATITVERTKVFGNLGVDVDIQVPSRSDLDVELSAGELSIAAITGNKTITMNAGEIDVDVGRVADYGLVSASVWAGELQAWPFGQNKEGVFRSFNWTGEGPYRIQASLKAGEMTFHAPR